MKDDSFQLACLSLFAPTVIDTPADLIEGHEELIAPLFEGSGIFLARIDLLPIRTRDELFHNVSRACGFPASFGFNWDALKDSLLDFSWMKPKPNGILLVYQKPGLLNWTDLSEFIILADRVRSIYAQHRKPFKVLMGHSTAK